MLLLGLYGIGGIGHCSFRNRIGEDALLFLGIVDTEGGLDVQILQGVDVEKHVAEGAPVTVTVVAVAVETGHRVLTVGIAAYRTGVLAIGGVYRQRGIELKHILQESARGLYFVGTVKGEMLAHRQQVSVANPDEFIVGIHTGREALEVALLDNTFILIITQREERRAALRAVAQRDIILLYQSRAGGLVKPVCISSGRRAGSIEILVHGDAIKHGLTLGVVCPVVSITQTVGIRIKAIVHITLPHHLAELLGIEHFHLVGVGLNCQTGIEVDSHLALLASLGSDDDHTIGSTASVNTGRCGILQHLDALDVVTVQFVHTGLCGHTVDDVERVVVVQRTDTTNADGRTT